MSNKVKTMKCPFCGGIMSPVYNGNRVKHVVYSWECSRSNCQFNEDYFGACGLEHRNMKKIIKMQKRIDELESELNIKKGDTK